MKKKEFAQLKNSSAQELRGLVHDYRLRLRALQFDLAAGKVKNAHELTTVKKDIARLLTLLQIHTIKERTV